MRRMCVQRGCRKRERARNRERGCRKRERKREGRWSIVDDGNVGMCNNAPIHPLDFDGAATVSTPRPCVTHATTAAARRATYARFEIGRAPIESGHGFQSVCACACECACLAFFFLFLSRLLSHQTALGPCAHAPAPAAALRGGARELLLESSQLRRAQLHSSRVC